MTLFLLIWLYLFDLNMISQTPVSTSWILRYASGG
jgi:hypothetical protein